MSPRPPTSTRSASRAPTPSPAPALGRREEHERLRLLGMLVANVAHEINNHLSYLHGNLERVVRHLPQLSATSDQAVHEQATGDAEAALDGARRIAELVRSLSTFARGDTLAQQMDPLQALNVALCLARERMDGRAQLVLDLAPLPAIDGCESQLSQVLLNLLINAADALPQGAPQTQQIRVRSAVQGQTISIEVADTGHGIAAEDIDHVFEPFYTTKPPGAGTGLGLSISRELVERMGGAISITSRPGEGCTFRVELPVRPERSHT